MKCVGASLQIEKVVAVGNTVLKMDMGGTNREDHGHDDNYQDAVGDGDGDGIKISSRRNRTGLQSARTLRRARSVCSR